MYEVNTVASGFWKILVKWNQIPFGWSETWYMTSSPISGAIAWLQNYVSGRTQLMPNTATFVSATVSDANNVNVSQMVGPGGVPFTVGRYPVSTPNIPADPTEAALRIYCVTASQKHKTFMMSAIPQEIQQGNTYLRNMSLWVRSFPYFTAAILGTPGSSTTIGQLRIIDQTQVKYPLTSVAINATDSRFMECSTGSQVMIQVPGNPPVPLAVGNRVIIRRVQPSIEVNRVWLVSSITPPSGGGSTWTYNLGPHRTLGNINQNPSGAVTGYIRPLVYIGDNVVNITDQNGIWKRDRGKQYGLPVGRRRVR
jgi:hypothetical protein